MTTPDAKRPFADRRAIGRSLVVLTVAASGWLAGCNDDPAKRVKIDRAGPGAVTSPDARFTLAFPEGLCPPLAEPDTGPSRVLLQGACAFIHTAAFACRSIGDDMHLSMTRPLKTGQQLSVQINIEKYHGPGEYTNDVQIHLNVQTGPDFYRFSTWTGAATVLPDEKGIVLTPQKLPAEPSHRAADPETISGLFACRPPQAGDLPPGP